MPSFYNFEARPELWQENPQKETWESERKQEKEELRNRLRSLSESQLTAVFVEMVGKEKMVEYLATKYNNEGLKRGLASLEQK